MHRGTQLSALVTEHVRSQSEPHHGGFIFLCDEIEMDSHSPAVQKYVENGELKCHQRSQRCTH